MNRLPQLCILLQLIFCFSTKAQFITLASNTWTHDYCGGSGAPINLSVTNPDPGLTYEWAYENNFDFWQTGQSTYPVFATGSATSLMTSSLPYPTMVNVYGYDSQHFPVASAFFTIGMSPNLMKIPIYFDQNNCTQLYVPAAFSRTQDAINRWSMWYKNGIYTGNTAPFINGAESGTYVYKLKLECGDTLTSDPYVVNAPGFPTPAISSGNTVVCNGDSVLLSYTPSGSAVSSYQWLKNGSAISASNSPTYKAFTNGNYTLMVNYTSGNGTTCSKISAAILVTVNTGAVISTPDSSICGGDSTLLQCNAASSYSWYRNGVAIPNANTSSIYAKSTGNYNVITTGFTCNNSKTKNVTVYARPLVNLSNSGSFTICEGSGITLTATGNNINSYRWYKNGDTIAGGIDPAVFISKAGTYKCVGSNVIGCTRSSAAAIISISGNTLPVKTLILQPGADGNDSYIEGYTSAGNNFGNATFMEVSNFYKYFRTNDRGLIKFDLSGIAANANIISANIRLYIDSVAGWTNASQTVQIKRVEQSWSESTVNYNNKPAYTDFQSIVIPHSSIVQKSTVQKNIVEIVNYWIKNQARNNGLLFMMNEAVQYFGWLRFATSDYSTASKRPKLTVNYTYAAIDTSGNTTFCNGDSVTLSTNTGPYTYQWFKNNVTINGATSSSYKAKTSGAYSVTISSAGGCTVSSETKSVTVNANPAATITAGGSLTFCNGDSVKLNANTGASLSYSWYKNNVVIAGAISSSYTAKTAGNFKTKVTNVSGCTKISNVLTTTVPCRLAGDIEDNNVVAMPNPSGNNFEISINGNLEIYNIQVFDIEGRLIESSSQFPDDRKIGGNWPEGIYMLKLHTSEGLQYKKLVKL